MGFSLKKGFKKLSSNIKRVGPIIAPVALGAVNPAFGATASQILGAVAQSKAERAAATASQTQPATVERLSTSAADGRTPAEAPGAAPTAEAPAANGPERSMHHRFGNGLPPQLLYLALAGFLVLLLIIRRK
jgi:hypothetical protein